MIGTVRLSFQNNNTMVISGFFNLPDRPQEGEWLLYPHEDEIDVPPLNLVASGSLIVTKSCFRLVKGKGIPDITFKDAEVHHIVDSFAQWKSIHYGAKTIFSEAQIYWNDEPWQKLPEDPRLIPQEILKTLV